MIVGTALQDKQDTLAKQESNNYEFKLFPPYKISTAILENWWMLNTNF